VSIPVSAVKVVDRNKGRDQMKAQPERSIQTDESRYEFVGGFPTEETVQNAYDDADLLRAVEAYKFFWPTVSILGTWDGNTAAGQVPNKSVLLLHGRPEQIVFTQTLIHHTRAATSI
jgi:hypothetical protein